MWQPIVRKRSIDMAFGDKFRIEDMDEKYIYHMPYNEEIIAIPAGFEKYNVEGKPGYFIRKVKKNGTN